MNPELPIDPRKALEASLTALLLGELPEDQARFLKQAIATDPELAKTFESLKHTVELVREAQASPRIESGETTAPLKLSEKKRAALLQQFKTIPVPAFSRPAPRLSTWLVPLAAALALLFALTSLMVPALSRSKNRSQAQRGEPHIQHSARLSDNSDRTHEAFAQLSGQRLEELSPENGRAQPIEATKQAAESTSLTVSGEARPEAKQVQPPREVAVRNAGNNIVLPSQPPTDQILLSGTQEPTARDVQFSTFGLPPKFEAPTTQNRDTTFTYRQGGDLAGAGQRALPILGDAPELGRMFQVQTNNEKAPASAPALQLDKNGLAWQYPQGASYGGGGFGGYSSITPLPPGEPYQLATVPGVAEVPVLRRQLAEEGQKPGLAQTLAKAPPAVETEAAGKLKVETGKELAKDERKQEVDRENLKRRLARVDVADQFDKKTATRSKSAEAQLGVGLRGLYDDDAAAAESRAPAPVPQPEVATRTNPFSTFSLNVSDVSFKLAAASLEQGKMPDPAAIRSEEFLNAFDYRDPEPAAGASVSFVSECAQDPFAQNRDLLRFSLKTAAAGRPANRPLNLVLLLDNSGSMERADRVQIIHEALRVLATQLHPQDRLSVVTFARTARLWVDGVSGDQAGRVADELSGLTPQGGTNLEEAMNLAYQTALRHYNANGINRVVLLTDGAANLGDTDPEVLRQKVETNRKQGIALDCFGIGWESYNDTLLEELTRHGDGRYGFINSPEEAASGFATQLAGALQVAASDVKIQVEFNPNRVTSYRQIGYVRHQLTKEQFRDNSVDAAEIGAAESGNALYVIETNPTGDGPLATIRVRYKLPGTADYREQEWNVPFTARALPLEQAGPAMRLAAVSGAFSEWLAQSPFAADVAPDRLLNYLNGVPAVYGADPRPQKLEWMIRQAKTISGK